MTLYDVTAMTSQQRLATPRTAVTAVDGCRQQARVINEEHVDPWIDAAVETRQ